VNETTRSQLEDALADESEDAPGPARVFETAEAQRAPAAGKATLSALGSFVAVEAARKLLAGKATKTWRTRSGNPRKSHARMDGETVDLDKKFSNGLNWPGDPAKGADEVAGCECTVEVNPVSDD
jgi:hypothetical protein